jgi:hypothetical protein
MVKNVKMNALTKAVFSAMLFVSTAVVAAEDYPAADFQPKVLYSDSSAQSSASPSAKAAEPVEADPNFPAANFQPKVVFNDADYKHSQTAPSLGASKSSAAATESVEEAVEAEQPVASNNNLIGLIVLAVVGFFLYNKKSAGKGAASVESAQAVNSGDATGVEKYLEKQGLNKTGVAKYLEKQGANPATGVAKYMAKQIVKDREAAAAKTTGVERYLRNKG